MVLLTIGTLLSIGAVANMIKGYAIAIGVAFGIWIVWMWWQHARNMARIAAEAQAKAIYGRYLELALAHPELAHAPPGPTSESRAKLQYEWFVGYLLNTADQILLVDPTPAWRATLASHLALHKGLLGLSTFRDGPYKQFSAPLRELIDSALRP